MDQLTPPKNFQIATVGIRFLNLVIDTILYEILMFLVINPLFRLVFGNSILSNYWNNFLFALIMLFLYYFVFEIAFQKTPAKFITRTKVIMADGLKPDIGTIAKRTLIRFVPFEVISMNQGNDPKKKGTWWHDRWAATRVVKS